MLSALETINAKVSIMRPTESRDARGSIVNTYRTAAQYVPCIISTQSAFEADQYGGPRSSRRGFALFPFNNDVRPQDQLKWGTRTLEVTGINPKPHNEDGSVSHLQVEWTEINEGPVNSNVISAPGGEV